MQFATWVIIGISNMIVTICPLGASHGRRGWGSGLPIPRTWRFCCLGSEAACDSGNGIFDVAEETKGIYALVTDMRESATE